MKKHRKLLWLLAVLVVSGLIPVFLPSRQQPISPFRDVEAAQSSATINSSTNTATFEYIVWSSESPRPEKANAYMNLYDDEFRFIKRLLFRKEVDIGEWHTVDWNFSAYAPGEYSYTIYSQDERGNQSHVRGGKFTIPEHTITGTRDPYPDSDPDLGWENEGPIARVRRPALVVASMIGYREHWEFQAKAEHAASILKNMGYKLVGDNRQLVGWTPFAPWHRDWLRASGIFYFSGHGMPGGIGAEPTFEGWHLFSNELRIDDPYKFVFLDACEAGSDNSFARAFGTLGANRAFLGWTGGVELGWWNPFRLVFLDARGWNNTNWTYYFWDNMAEGDSVDQATDDAGSSPSTRNVATHSGLALYGDPNIYLK